MPSTIIVNFMTTQHKASVGMTTGFPDVCKTPAPPAPSPVPIPYPNVGMSSMASSKVTKKVKNNGQKVMVKGSAYTITSGDEAGVMFGVISNRIKGKSEILNCSFDVKYEGKGVGRLTDPHGNNCGSKCNVPVVGEVQAPNIVVALWRGWRQEAACKRVKKNCHREGEKKKEVLKKCGMDEDHANAISKVCKAEPPSSITFRSTNTDSLRHIKSGFRPKGSDIKEKTISKSRMDDYAGYLDENQMGDLDEVYGLVGEYDSNGKLKGVKTTEGYIPLDDIPPSPLSDGSVHKKGVAYTGDYDAHDCFGKGGQRLTNGSAGEKSQRRRINRSIGRKSAGGMVQHGPQNNYTDYCKAEGIEPLCKLQLPDVSAEEPLLAFDENGEMYELSSEKQLRDYYKCKGQDVPEEWDEPKRSEIEACVERQSAAKGKKPVKFPKT